MTIQAYYRHARSIGPFRAVDCLAMARQAFALDEAGRLARLPTPGAASYEVMPDGDNFVRLSFSVKVF